MSNTPWGRVAAERLQMSVRIAELEAMLAATSPAWGPPQAQPDTPGWWVFDATDSDRNEWQGVVRLSVRGGVPDVTDAYWLDDMGMWTNELTGRWWRLHMPWEVQP